MSFMNVVFQVQINELLDENERIFVCGSTPELGSWYPMRSKELRRKEFSKIKRLEVWDAEMVLPMLDISYRYFIATTDYDHESSDEKTVNISTWESHVNPRMKPLLSNFKNGIKTNTTMDTYGSINGHYRVLKGWLTDQTIIELRLNSDSIKLFKAKYKSKSVFLKCIYYHMDKSHWSTDDYNDELSNVTPPKIAKFSKLTEENYFPTFPPPQGVEFSDEFMVFYIETMDLEDTMIEIEVKQLACDLSSSLFSVSRAVSNGVNQASTTQGMAENDDFFHIGTARLGPMTPEKSTKSISIYNSHNRPVGELKIECIAIYPLLGLRYAMKETYMLHWKHRKTLNVGHRGLGASYGYATKVSTVRENTLFSFRKALDHGADYVEFDVQLSKDKIPVLYHDFQVCTVLRKKRKNDLQYLEIPVKDLTLNDLHSLKLDPTCFLLDEQRDERMNMEDIDPRELQPFPTLQSCLEEIQPDLGFNIEFKYPQNLLNGQSEQTNYFDRNIYVDVILRVVSNYADKRRIIFSSFDADVCLMLSLKQNKYPVLFLTQGDTDHFDAYQDIRAQSVINALYFAKSSNILGLSVYSDAIHGNTDIVNKILNKHLILFIWGEEFNNTEAMDRWRKLGVHGLIFDRFFRIHELNQHSTMNIFHLPSTVSSSLSTEETLALTD